MNRECAKNIYIEFLKSYKYKNHDEFVKSKSEKHNVDPDEIEELIVIYGSYQCREMMGPVKMYYSEDIRSYFEIIDQAINECDFSSGKKWWQFWRK